MDDRLKQRISEYANTAYAAALHNSNQMTVNKIAEAKARLAQRGIILSGQTVHEIAKLQGDHINTVVQARADALLDAYELYGAEIDDVILADVKSLRATLVGHAAASSKDSGLPPGVPAFQMFQPLLETNTGAIVNSISCQIEQRKVVPKFRRADIDRCFEEMAIQEARQSVAEDQRLHPRVGAVVVKDGKVVSKAHRGENPRCHAEYIALEGKLPDDLVAGSTVYTTLEPCTTRNHPKIPCAQRLIERRVNRVFIGMLDPNPEIRGLGIQALNEAGIETQLFPRDLQSQIEELNRDFIRVQKQRQARVNASPKTSSEPEGNPKVAEILKYKGKTVTVFNRQKYGNGYLEGFWGNGAVIVDCTPLWVVLEDPVAKSKQSFPLPNVEVVFDFEKNRLQLTVYR
jgi:pyrimidine deaminase RibD-like protein